MDKSVAQFLLWKILRSRRLISATTVESIFLMQFPGLSLFTKPSATDGEMGPLREESIMTFQEIEQIAQSFPKEACCSFARESLWVHPFLISLIPKIAGKNV